MVGPLQMALSPATRVRSANNWYWRTRTVMENTFGTSHPTRLHYPKWHGRLRAKTRFSKGSHDPPYKSRGCGMPGAGFRATISPKCIYGVSSEFSKWSANFPRVISSSRDLGRIIRAREFLVSLDFWEGRLHVTYKFKGLQRESAHASGTVRKPSTRCTR